MALVDAKLRATTGSSTPPTASAAGMIPGYVVEERVDPSLTSFSTLGNGTLCGKATAASFANAPVPPSFLGAACTANYASANRMLDLLIDGCASPAGGPQITPSQPDVSRDGALYVFAVNASHMVTSCTRNGAAEVLTTCLTNAAYSSMFELTFNRVTVK